MLIFYNRNVCLGGKARGQAEEKAKSPPAALTRQKGRSCFFRNQLLDTGKKREKRGGTRRKKISWGEKKSRKKNPVERSKIRRAALGSKREKSRAIVSVNKAACASSAELFWDWTGSKCAHRRFLCTFWIRVVRLCWLAGALRNFPPLKPRI